ncbi:hypothetical protein PIB30_041035 [Stylosanthes scabra]|uniref:Zinc knuckle CX2CX4HX4C domain-containing protein n=1 Tax=Stylosanthes scabra TaxID=79078 RepID=A0ABU6RFI1_9FABA|nr:hypothetical protein [Stylosanthes scabra]
MSKMKFHGLTSNMKGFPLYASYFCGHIDHEETTCDKAEVNAGIETKKSKELGAWIRAESTRTMVKRQDLGAGSEAKEKDKKNRMKITRVFAAKPTIRKFGKTTNTTVSISSTTIPNLAPKIQATVQRPEITVSKIPNIQEEALSTEFQANIESKFQFNATYLDVPDLAFNGRIPTPVSSDTEDGAVVKGMAEPFSHFMEGDDASDLTSIAIGSVDDTSLEQAEARANRPPSEPPNSNLLEVGKKEPASAEEMSRRPAKVTDSVTGIHYGAEVGAFVERMWTAAGRRTATMEADRSLQARQLRRFFLLTPSPLLAAIFPWERGERSSSYEEASFSSSLTRPTSLRETVTSQCDTAFTPAGFPWSHGSEVAISGGGATQNLVAGRGGR